MVACRVIPCLDVDAGRVVKGTRFLDLRDAGDPVELAAFYDAEGADELVFLDITASSQGRDTTLETVSRTADQVFIPLTVGGGVRSEADVERLLRAGADKVAINSAAVADPSLLERCSHRFGSQCVVLAIDARRGAGGGWVVHTHGGRVAVDLDAVAWAREGELRGAGEILMTSMDRDGTRDGYDVELMARTAAATNLPLVASGGAGNADHMRAVLTDGGAQAALAASIFHFGELSIAATKEHLDRHGLTVRMAT